MTSEDTAAPPSAARKPLREKVREVLELLGLTHFHRIVAMVLASATLMIAVATYLEVEAHSSAQTASAQAQVKQIQASTVEINGKSQVNFDYGSAYRTWLELDLQAQSAEKAKDTVSRDRYIAARDKIRGESLLLSSEYFPDAGDGNAPGYSGTPDVAGYEVYMYYHQVQVLQQEAAALDEIKEFWHRRQSGFLTTLAFLSSALFVTGLALTTPRVLARWLVGAGTLAVVGSLAWVTYARFGPEPHVNEEAILNYADGKSMVYRAVVDSDYDEAIDDFTEALHKDEEYVDALVARADAHVDAGILILGTEQDAAVKHFHEAIHDFEEARGLGHNEPRSLWNFGWVYYLIGDYDHAIAIDKEALAKEPDLFAVRHNLGLAYLVRGKQGDAELAAESFRESQAEAVRQLTPTNGTDAPGSTWSEMEDMALDFENLWLRLDGRKYTWIQAPAVDSITDPAGTKEQAAKLRDQLESLVVRLEAGEVPSNSNGVFPKSPAAAASKREVTKLDVTGYQVDENRKRINPQKGPDLSGSTTDIVFDVAWTGMDNPKRVAWRIYRNGKQDRLRGRAEPWSPDWLPNDSLTIPISYSYSSLWHFKSGYYVFELYVDNVLMKRTSFSITD